MSEFPEEEHLRKIERLPGNMIALLDYPMNWGPDKKPKAVAILEARITKDRPKVGAIVEIAYFNKDYYADGEKTVFPIDPDRGIKVAPRDAERIIKDCTSEMFEAIRAEIRDNLCSGGILKIYLPDDRALYSGFELAVSAQLEPKYRNKVELIKEPEAS